MVKVSDISCMSCLFEIKKKNKNDAEKVLKMPPLNLNCSETNLISIQYLPCEHVFAVRYNVKKPDEEATLQSQKDH